MSSKPKIVVISSTPVTITEGVGTLQYFLNKNRSDPDRAETCEKVSMMVVVMNQMIHLSDSIDDTVTKKRRKSFDGINVEEKSKKKKKKKENKQYQK